MKRLKLLTIISLSLVAYSCASDGQKDEGPLVKELYKQGDKVTLWSITEGPSECVVKSSLFNPYSSDKRRKYKLTCNKGKADRDNITNQDFAVQEARKKAYEESELENAKQDAEGERIQKLGEPGLRQSIKDYQELQRLKQKAYIKQLKKDAGE